MDRPRDSRDRPRPALTERLRRWLRPPRRLRPTRAGWTFFALTLGVGFAALNTGNNLLYLVLSLMLAFLVLSGVLSESALRGIRVRRRLPRELHAGSPAVVALEIENRQRRAAAFAVVVEDRLAGPGSPRAGGAFALRIGPGAVERRSYAFTPGQRGALDFSHVQVLTRFPFGLFSKSLTLPAPGRALVYPALEPVRPRFESGVASEGERRVADATTPGSSAAGLRPFAPGDPARRIHWRASLKRRALLALELDGEREAEVEVFLPTRGSEPGERFERAVRRAASEVVALLEARARVALRTDTALLGAASGARQRARLLAFLALVEPGTAAAAELA